MNRIISPATAYTIASQWGSFVRTGDPGAIFYTFPPGDARPVDEAHRADCIVYARRCLSLARHRHGHADQLIELGFDLPDHDSTDVDELESLVEFFECSPLAPGRRMAA